MILCVMVMVFGIVGISNAEQIWVKYEGNPVVDTGPGVWDSNAVLSPSVMKDGDTYRMWYGGRDGSLTTHIGYAESPGPPPLTLEYEVKTDCRGENWSFSVRADGYNVIDPFDCGGRNKETILLSEGDGVVELIAEDGVRECTSSFSYWQDMKTLKLECVDGLKKGGEVKATFEINRKRGK